MVAWQVRRRAPHTHTARHIYLLTSVHFHVSFTHADTHTHAHICAPNCCYNSCELSYSVCVCALTMPSAESVVVPIILEPFLSGMAAIHDMGLIHRDIKVRSHISLSHTHTSTYKLPRMHNARRVRSSVVLTALHARRRVFVCVCVCVCACVCV